MLPLPNSKTNKNTGQNCSTYSFTITKQMGKIAQLIPSPLLIFEAVHQRLVERFGHAFAAAAVDVRIVFSGF